MPLVHIPPRLSPKVWCSVVQSAVYVGEVVIFPKTLSYLITVHERYRQTDGRTDRQRDGITVTIPHFALKCIAARAVKMKNSNVFYHK